MSDPVFLTIEQVKTLHRIALDQYGGQDGVRDAATLESAVMHPCNVWLYGQGDLFDIAALHAPASQAPFRTGLNVAAHFISIARGDCRRAGLCFRLAPALRGRGAGA